MVQLAGAPPPATNVQAIVDCGFGSNAFSDTAQRARSKAARLITPAGPPQMATAFAAPTQLWTASGLRPPGSTALAAACSAASVEANWPVPPALNVVVTGGVAPAQYSRLECIAEASPAASIAARARRRDVVVLDSASACIFAIPSSPTQMTTTATMTSTRLKPAVQVLMPRYLISCK